MANQPSTDVDPKELERAQDMWVFFTKAMKWCVIATAVVLIGMALFLV